MLDPRHIAAQLLKLGAAKSQCPAALRLVEVEVAKDGVLAFCLRKEKLRELCRRERRDLLRANLCTDHPAQIWQLYMLLTQIEEAFKRLKVISARVDLPPRR